MRLMFESPKAGKKRGFSMLVPYMSGYVATGMKGEELKIYPKKEAKASHLLSALGRRRKGTTRRDPKTAVWDRILEAARGAREVAKAEKL